MSNPSNSLIKMRTAAKMIERHDEFRRNYNNQLFKPVQSIQFSIDAIETYLEYVKTLSRLRGVEVSGIRVVNAVYASNYEKEEKANNQTVLFIPTYKNEKDEDEAFDPLYIHEGKPLNLSELLKDAGAESEDGNLEKSKKQQQVMYSRSATQESSSFMNFGSMGKPPL